MWDPRAIGRRGGLSKSPRKAEAARRNAKLGGAKGGRPPKLPPEPEGLRAAWKLPHDSPDHALKKFAEYHAEYITKKNGHPEQFGWDEQELQDTLERMGRPDLIKRRQKLLAGLSPKVKRNLKWMRKNYHKLVEAQPA